MIRVWAWEIETLPALAALSSGQFRGELAEAHGFVYVRGDHLEGQTHQRKELVPTRRG